MYKGSAIPSYLPYLVLVEKQNLLYIYPIYVLKQIAKKGVTLMAGVITSCNIRESAAIRSLKGMAAGVPLNRESNWSCFKLLSKHLRCAEELCLKYCIS